MSPHFIPQQDGLALAWMLTFARNISAQTSAYMLGPGDAATIQQAVDAYAVAYAEANDPATRTRVTVNIKDTMRNSAIQLCRLYARLIKPNAGVSDASKIAIGVPPINPHRQGWSSPATSPLIQVIAATYGKQTLRYADSMTPKSRAKPPGAAQLNLFLAIGDSKATDPETAKFVRAFTRNPIEVEFKTKDGGKMATYFGRWETRRGELGPWSAPIGMHIAA